MRKTTITAPKLFHTVSALLLASALMPVAAQQNQVQPQTLDTRKSAAQAEVQRPQVLPVTVPYSVPVPDSQSAANQSRAQVLLSQALPQSAVYVVGSSRLNGLPVADPVRGPSGTLYWTLPARNDGVLTFQVTALPAQVAALTLPSLHSIDPQVSGAQTGSVRYLPINGSALVMSDLVQAQPFQAAEVVSENAGAIKLPAQGTTYRTRDKITVTVEGPLGDAPVPVVNGVPARADQVGTTITDPQRGVQRLEYYGLSIRTGENHITLGQDDVKVYLAGPTSRIDIEPLNVIADGVTPIRLRLRALDAQGIRTNEAYLTLSSNLEPLKADANPGEGGYQVALQEGEGLLELRPQTTPITLHLEMLAGRNIMRRDIDISPDQHAVGVGMLSATLGLGSGSLSDNFSVRARAYYEGPLSGGKLYIAADKDGLPTTTNALPTNERFTNYGDSSVETLPLQGADPVAFIYDNPRFRVSYRLSQVPLVVLPLSTQITALTVESKTNPALSGFVASVPSGQITGEVVQPEGTRLLRLGHNDIIIGSQVLTLVKLDRVSGAELSRTPLTEGADYSIDPQTGIVTLARALSSVDGDLNTQYVNAAYRIADPKRYRSLAYGVQLAQRGEAGAGHYEVGAAVVSMDSTVTFGVAGKYIDPQIDAGANVFYSGGVLASAHLNSKYGLQGERGGAFSVRYQSDGYTGLSAGSKGFTASGRYNWQLNKTFGVRLEGEYNPQSSLQAGSDGSVGVLGTYKLSPWTVGAGVRYGFGAKSGFGVTGLVGYNRDPLNVELSQTVPVSGTLSSTTELKVGYHINQWTTLQFRDVYDWKTGNAGALSLTTTLGNTNYIAAYETANGSGQENRARFGVGTSLVLSDRSSVGLRAAYLRNLQSQTNELTAGADLAYKGDNYRAGVGADLSYRSDTGTLGVLHGGVSGDINEHLNLSADATSEVGARQGLKFGLGYAYRASELSSLGYFRYLQGSLAGGNDNVSGGVAAEYRQPTFAVRAGFDARMLLSDHDTLTYQPYIGANLYFADRFSVGAWGRALLQPATSTSLYGYGLEAGIKVLPSLWLSAGYNLKGFDGIPTAGFYTKPGLYLRLDLTLDETLNGVRK